MHDTRVKLKDGRTFRGPIWDWRPKDGWFSIVESDGSMQFRFAEVESVTTDGQRVSVNSPPEGETVDELARARRHGWDGT